MAMTPEPLETQEASGFPFARQLSVFLENRLGQLLAMAKLFDQTEVRILGLSVVYSVDCAVVRLLVDEPDEAAQLLRKNGFAVSESDILVVNLPPGKRGLMAICAALVGAEVSIQYTYPLLTRPNGRPAVALQVDDLDMALQTLTSQRFQVLDQDDLRGGD
ncbi:MAG: acetolactate synthase [Phycisphaerae bacterium]